MTRERGQTNRTSQEESREGQELDRAQGQRQGQQGSPQSAGGGVTAGQGSDVQGRQRGDRERSLATSRETGGSTGVSSRRAGTAGNIGLGSSPFSLMQRMADDMDRLFEQFGFPRMGLSMSPLLSGGTDVGTGQGATGGMQRASWAPQVEIVRRGDEIVVRADVPGLKKDDLHVDVEDDVLVLSGERRSEHEDRGDGYYRTERSYGRFERAIPLPEGVDAEKCEATYRDGVLEVKFPAPRVEQQRGRRIEIH